MSKRVLTIKAFREWVEQAQPGAEAVYGPHLMATARKFFDEDKAILYQRRVRFNSGPDMFTHHAQRVSTRAAGWLALMSKSTAAPHNPRAHEEQVRRA